jgi:methylmalonyl-CoA mutase
MTEDLTLTEFPPVSTAEWDAAVLKDRKGVAPETRLYYRAEDLRGLEYLDSAPGVFPYTRGTRGANDWGICEVVKDAAGARAALAGGATEISLAVEGANIDELLDSLPTCPVHFEAGERAAELLEALARRGLARGSVDYEPLADFDRAANLVRLFHLPDFHPVTVRAHLFAEAGASAVGELAFALAEGVEMLARFTDRGLTPDDAARALAFSFSIGSNYFFEIAKLRAARTLWARAVESFGRADAGAAKMTIYARTAHWTKTIYDSHVNLLRATTEAMAAAIGGVDSLWVEPFDASYREPSESSVRLARNTQLILKREAGIDQCIDAAGGAYYLEVLTDSLAREGWELLRKIEALGGFLKYAASGSLDLQIAISRANRETAVSARRTTVVGTNQYPNLQERILPEIERPDFAPRPARVFEEIRLCTERYAARTGHTPRFLLLEAGDLKMRKARSAFAANLFGCAGFEIEISGILAGDPDVVVLCSSDLEYESLAPQVIQQLRDSGKATPVILAGNSADSGDVAAMLRTWQERLGVSD